LWSLHEIYGPLRRSYWTKIEHPLLSFWVENYWPSGLYDGRWRNHRAMWTVSNRQQQDSVQHQGPLQVRTRVSQSIYRQRNGAILGMPFTSIYWKLSISWLNIQFFKISWYATKRIRQITTFKRLNKIWVFIKQI
jgi:hypothetical protein